MRTVEPWYNAKDIPVNRVRTLLITCTGICHSLYFLLRVREVLVSIKTSFSFNKRHDYLVELIDQSLKVRKSTS